MKDIDPHVGYDAAAAKARVLDAIRRAEAGAVTEERHVTFESWDGLARTLSAKRLELLRQMRQAPAPSVAQLARRLGRDDKRVHEPSRSWRRPACSIGQTPAASAPSTTKIARSSA